MRPLALAPLLALAAAPAMAQCLDETALGRGVVVAFENGDLTTMRRTADGTIQVDESFANGNPTIRLRAARGIYYYQEFELDAAGQEVPGSRLDIVFPVPFAELPAPAAGIEWAGRTLNRFADGTERPEETSIRFDQGAPLRLSGCDYAVLDAALRYDWGAEGGLTLRYDYLPALGVGIVRSSQFDGEARNEKVPVALTPATK